MYKATNIDTDKALEAIDEARKIQERSIFLEIEKKRAYQEGINKAFDITESIFKRPNYEKKKEPTYTDGILDFIYELGKELDVPTEDLRKNITSIDETCVELANRIRERFAEDGNE